MYKCIMLVYKGKFSDHLGHVFMMTEKDDVQCNCKQAQAIPMYAYCVVHSAHPLFNHQHLGHQNHSSENVCKLTEYYQLLVAADMKCHLDFSFEKGLHKYQEPIRVSHCETKADAACLRQGLQK